MSKKPLYYAITIVSAILLLVVGNISVSRESSAGARHEPTIVPAVVTEIVSRTEEYHVIRPGFSITYVDIDFVARITSGEHDGEYIRTAHTVMTDTEIRRGDRILLIYNEFRGQFFFFDFVRINHIFLLGFVFFGLLLAFGRGKGVAATVALGLTCAAIFLVFIPAILAGVNIYAATFLLCTYGVLVTLLLVVGFNTKTLSAALGCLGGILFAGGLMLIMNVTLRLTGFVDHDAQQLFALPYPVNLRAIIFSGVIIGAMGAIMDVAMSIASSLWELKRFDKADFAELFKSGINIGQDIMGTMLNTLILAYIGSSLSMILVLSAGTLSPTRLMNTEMIAVEILRALIGSFGMLLAIPLTAAICAWLYSAPSAQ
ncbi:MAG: YibE/F family protein [Defluviitaleaceae bacterium]|nr:YibE/F family protein [Defluviitaleaceae bacterium]